MPLPPRVTIGHGLDLAFDPGHLTDSLLRRDLPREAAELVATRPGLDPLPELPGTTWVRQIGRWYSHFFPGPGDDFGPETFVDVERIQTHVGQNCGSGAGESYVASNQW